MTDKTPVKRSQTFGVTQQYRTPNKARSMSSSMDFSRSPTDFSPSKSRSRRSHSRTISLDSTQSSAKKSAKQTTVKKKSKFQPLIPSDEKWIAAGKTTTCMICCQASLVYERPYNCRKCGKLMCHECGNYSYQGYQVCRKCIMTRKECDDIVSSYDSRLSELETHQRHIGEHCREELRHLDLEFQQLNQEQLTLRNYLHSLESSHQLTRSLTAAIGSRDPASTVFESGDRVIHKEWPNSLNETKKSDFVSEMGFSSVYGQCVRFQVSRVIGKCILQSVLQAIMMQIRIDSRKSSSLSGIHKPNQMVGLDDDITSDGSVSGTHTTDLRSIGSDLGLDDKYHRLKEIMTQYSPKLSDIDFCLQMSSEILDLSGVAGPLRSVKLRSEQSIFVSFREQINEVVDKCVDYLISQNTITPRVISEMQLTRAKLGGIAKFGADSRNGTSDLRAFSEVSDLTDRRHQTGHGRAYNTACYDISKTWDQCPSITNESSIIVDYLTAVKQHKFAIKPGQRDFHVAITDETGALVECDIVCSLSDVLLIEFDPDTSDFNLYQVTTEDIKQALSELVIEIKAEVTVV